MELSQLMLLDTRMSQLLTFELFLFGLPVCRVVSGCVTKGYVGCPCCGEHTTSRRSIALKKNIYSSHLYRKWLNPTHPLWDDSVKFSGSVDHCPTSSRPTGALTIRHGRLRQTFLYNGGTPKSSDLVSKFGVNRVSILFQLPYWKVIFY